MFGLKEIDFFEVVETFHTYQNPTSEQKLDQLIEYIEAKDGSQILDVGCGKGWLLRRIAQKYAIQGVGVELREGTVQQAHELNEQTTLKGKLDFVQMDAKQFQPSQQFDIVMCIGASFAIGTFEDMLDIIVPWVKPGGVLAVGDIYARVESLPKESAVHFSGGHPRTFSETIAMLDTAPLDLVAAIDSSLDEWDRYESLHAYAANRWLRENPNHVDYDKFAKLARSFKRNHFFYDRDALGWSLFVSRVSGD